MSGFNFFRDGGSRLLDGIGSNAFQAGIDENRARQDAEIARQNAAYKQQRERQYHSSMAEAMRSGNVDRAAYVAYEFGDDKTGTGIGNVRKEQHARTGAANTSYANVAASLGRLPYEQRRGALASAAPRLVEMGLSPDEIAAFDPTDENLAAIAGVDYSLKDRDANDVAVYGANTDRFEADTKRMELDQPKVVGNAYVTPTGEVLYKGPEYHNFGLDQNVYVEPGTTSQGYTTTTGTSGGNVGQMSGLAGAGDPVWGAMIGAESNYRQTDSNGRPLTSSAGAIGIAQVMPATARETAGKLGIQWDENRYRTDPQYNAQLGHAYYREMLQRFNGDTTKAVAAYNAGPGGVDRAVARAARTGGNWTDYLPAETQGYVRKVTRNSQVQGQRQTGQNPQMLQRGVPKPVKGGKPEENKGEAMGHIDRAERSIRTLLQHPGLSAAVGSGLDPNSWGRINPITGKPFGGTDAAGFVSRHETLKAQFFLPMVQSLRGMGALSNAEGQKLEAAIGALSLDMSEAEYKQAANELLAEIGRIRADVNSGKRTINGAGGTAQPSAQAREYLVQNPGMRAQFDAKYGAGAAALVLGR